MDKRLLILAIAIAVCGAEPLVAEEEAKAAATTNTVAAADGEPKRIRVRKRGQEGIPEAKPTTIDVAVSVAVVEQNHTQPPEVVAALQLDKVDNTSIDVPAILAAVVAKASAAEVPSIMAAIESGITKMDVADIWKVVEVASRDKWYERFEGEPGSKMWWILNVAREMAKDGKDVSKLKEAFDITMSKWISEEE